MFRILSQRSTTYLYTHSDEFHLLWVIMQLRVLIMPKESLFPETILSSSFLNDSFVYLIIIIIPETESDSLLISLPFHETYQETARRHLQTYLLNAVLSWHNTNNTSRCSFLTRSVPIKAFVQNSANFTPEHFKETLCTFPQNGLKPHCTIFYYMQMSSIWLGPEAASPRCSQE